MSAANNNSNGEDETATGLLNSDIFLMPFLHILDESSSSMNISTVRSLAMKIFAHPQIFCGFDEFKSRVQLLLGEQQQQQDVSTTSLFQTLDLFSFGTLKDYNNNTDSKDYYLPLNEPALAKLGQLTVLTCIQESCFNGKTSISYDSLAELLGSASSSAAMQEDGATANIRETEDVLVRCIYSNVLKGKLCQKTRSFDWKGESLPVVLSRDVAPESVSGLLSALTGLGQRLEESEQTLGSAQHEVTRGLETTAKHWAGLQSQKDIHLEGLHSKAICSGGNSGPSPLYRQGGFSGQTSGGINPRRSSKRSRALGPANFVPMHRSSEL